MPSMSGAAGLPAPDVTKSATLPNLMKHPRRRQSVPDAFSSCRETHIEGAQAANQLARQKAYSFDDMVTGVDQQCTPAQVQRTTPIVVQGRVAPTPGRAPGTLSQVTPPNVNTQTTTPVQIPALGSPRAVGNAGTSLRKTDSSLGRFYPQFPA